MIGGVSTTGRQPGALGLDEDALVACVACGLCLPHCPTYRVTGMEVASPRGRIAAMRLVELEGAPIDEAFTEAMEACVQCRACELACPSSVPFGALMESTRAAMATSGLRPGPLGRLTAGIGFRLLVHHRLLRAAGWLLWAAARVRLVPRRFGVPRVRVRAMARRLRAAPPSQADVHLFRGCVMDVWQRDVHRSALTVMRATGATPALTPVAAPCCGALHAHAGRADEARSLAARVIAAIPGDADIVVDSAGCGAAMKDYGDLLGTPAAHAFSARVRDFSEWVVEQGVPPTTPTATAVVVQDPCHLRNVQRSERAVRTLLAGTYALRETDDDALCCGAGGAYAALQPQLAGAIRDRKIAALRRSSGDAPLVVASANPGCAMHLAAGGVDVRHPAELLAAALTTYPTEHRPNENPPTGNRPTEHRDA